MKRRNELTHCAGLRWAGDHHVVAVVGQQGIVVAEFRLAHRAAVEELERFPPPSVGGNGRAVGILPTELAGFPEEGGPSGRMPGAG